MKHGVWLLLLALAGCARPGTMVQTGAAPKACHAGPDGGRAVADRGIGGTGSPLVLAADRGIGGTGIIGVITGFGSVCVAGEEVALPPDVPTRLDETAASLDDLRAGQVIAMAASGPPAALQARAIVVRHAVIGPVQAVGPGTMTVAGQMVLVAGAAGPALDATPGQWVAVSGLPENGTVTASRIDPAAPGQVLVRGELIRTFGSARIGSLPVQLPEGFNLPAGWPVVVTGQLKGGVLVADTAARDVASESPSAYFGPQVSSFIVETTVAAVAGGYLVERDFVSGNVIRPGGGGRGIARFERGPHGLVATGLDLESPRGGSAAGAGGAVFPGGDGRTGRSPAGDGFGGLGGVGPGGVGPGGVGPGGVGPGVVGPGGVGSGGVSPGIGSPRGPGPSRR